MNDWKLDAYREAFNIPHTVLRTPKYSNWVVYYDLCLGVRFPLLALPEIFQPHARSAYAQCLAYAGLPRGDGRELQYFVRSEGPLQLILHEGTQG